MDRGLIKLVTGLLATAAVGVRIQKVAKEVASTRWPAIYQKNKPIKNTNMVSKYAVHIFFCLIISVRDERKVHMF